MCLLSAGLDDLAACPKLLKVRAIVFSTSASTNKDPQHVLLLMKINQRLKICRGSGIRLNNAFDHFHGFGKRQTLSESDFLVFTSVLRPFSVLMSDVNWGCFNIEWLVIERRRSDYGIPSDCSIQSLREAPYGGRITIFTRVAGR